MITCFQEKDHSLALLATYIAWRRSKGPQAGDWHLKSICCLLKT